VQKEIGLNSLTAAERVSRAKLRGACAGSERARRRAESKTAP
jgi:hypothetical protein